MRNLKFFGCLNILQSLNSSLYTLPTIKLVDIMHKKSSLKSKIEIWKEILPTIGKAELYRLLSRLKRHAKVLSCKAENGKIALTVSYYSFRDRINGRVILSSWIGKRNYYSVRLSKPMRMVRRKI